ncbi:MAG: hypothetical protein HY695_27505 [Deltaproteobacteria bacterium]|nr:hypothetical protein [Deltaproteobacteria bacterium]
MRLELFDFPVSRIMLANEFRYDEGLLVVDEDKIKKLVLEDPRIREVSLALAYPGEKVRITGIRDIVEPRVKVQGNGQIFPGVLSPVIGVGTGRTHRLSGMALVAAAEYEGTIRAGTAVERSAILDMWGPGAEASRFSSLVNLVLSLRLAEGLFEFEAHTAIQRAEFAVAKRLAETTIGATAAREEILDLTITKPNLPKVILVQGYITSSHSPHPGISYYGLPIRDSLATFIHPNELADGAVTKNTTRGVGYFPVVWDWQNHPLVQGLYRQHSRELNFAGLILERIRFETHHGKEVISTNTARLAAALEASGALITWLGSGNAFVDIMLTVRVCESLGIKTTLVTYEYGGKDGVDSPLLFYTSEADAVVSTGSRDRHLELPPAESVLGAYEQIRILSYPGAPLVSARNPLTLDARDMIIGGVDNWGRQSWTCKAY